VRSGHLIGRCRRAPTGLWGVASEVGDTGLWGVASEVGDRQKRKRTAFGFLLFFSDIIPK